LVILAGCTVIPGTVKPGAPSYDGADRTSGLVSMTATGAGFITAAARDRYNALVRAYGKRFEVPLTQDAGITPGPVLRAKATWKIDPEHLVKFQIMSRWRRQGVPPDP